MRPTFTILLALFAALLSCSPSMGQVGPPGSEPKQGAYCNVFYIESGDLEKLPLEDVCFITDQYTIQDPRHLRCVGPIEGQIDLFRAYPWAFHFYMPEVKEGMRLNATLPEDLAAGGFEMEGGQFAFTISDNRQQDRYVEAEDVVSMVAVGGSGRLTAYTAQGGDMAYPEYQLQLDLKVKEVETVEGKMVPMGKAFRLRMVLRVEELD